MQDGVRLSMTTRPDPDDLEPVVADKKLKYPKSVFFIVCNEFCERFSYYGMRTILSLYLARKLGYTENTATVIYHVFTSFVYFFPLFGAMLADSLLGKFRTIFYLSVIYALGQLILAATAAPILHIPIREFSLLGLLLIAIGTGGIKPCVAAFGGDQFVLPQQERYLVMFFSVFYFAINSGSLFSTFITPELRNGIECFGEKECYSIAFLVPAVLMVCSIVVFVLGKSMYKMKEPRGNVVLNVTKCISRAIYNKVSHKKDREHWLDHADDKFDKSTISDIKSTLQVLKLFIPLPIFWALFDQQGSRWTFQATRMNGQIGNYILKSDQMQVANPLFIVIFIPIFETCIYPVMAKIRMINTPLKKLTTGGLLAALAFIISGIVELQLQPTYPILPSENLGQLIVFNPQNCTMVGHIAGENVMIPPYDMWDKRDIEVVNVKNVEYDVNFTKCDKPMNEARKGQMPVFEEMTRSYPFIYDGADRISETGYRDFVNKSSTGSPAVRVLVHNEMYDSDKAPVVIHLIKEKGKSKDLNFTVAGLIGHSEYIEPDPAVYEITLNGMVVQEYDFKQGGVYTILIHITSEKRQVNVLTITQPNTIHILWLLPQYIIITMGEVMFSVTGLEFAFTQAPISMKSLLQASWLLTVAFGNVIVIIVAEVKFFDKQSSEFFFFAGLMIVDMIIFAIMAKYYKYIETSDSESVPSSESMGLPLEENGANINPSFVAHDEKL